MEAIKQFKDSIIRSSSILFGLFWESKTGSSSQQNLCKITQGLRLRGMIEFLDRRCLSWMNLM